MMVYVLCLVLFSLGLYCMLRKRNIIKIIIGVIIANYAVNLLLVLIAYREHGRAPIYAPDQKIENMVDALPQAVALTSIVVGLAVVIVLIALAMRLYEKYGTFNITKIRDLKG